MMLADDDIEIDDNFFDEFTSDLSSEDVLDFPEVNTECDLPMPSHKRDFSSFLTPWDPSCGLSLEASPPAPAPPRLAESHSSGGGRHSPQTTDAAESTSEHSSECGSDDFGKMKSRLEKNRESATKCRLKKKNELNTLTSKISTLVKTISQLTQENSALRADNASLTDHNKFLRGLISSQPELPLHHIAKAPRSESQQAAGAASGIAILGIFGAFTMFSSRGFLSGEAGGGVGRVLEIENPLQDLMQQQSGSQFHVFVVGVFVCLILYAVVSYYGFQQPSMMLGEKKKASLLPSHSSTKRQSH
jgi:hypothetical protein